jgi:hypothetical protein
MILVSVAVVWDSGKDRGRATTVTDGQTAWTGRERRSSAKFCGLFRRVVSTFDFRWSVGNVKVWIADLSCRLFRGSELYPKLGG